MSPRSPDSLAALSQDDLESLMVDWLYGELDGDKARAFEAHLEAHPEVKAEAMALQQTRAAFADFDEAEPSPALHAKLLHEAAKEIEAQEGLWAKIRAFFEPLYGRPGLMAFATLVLVAGVAGSLYSRGGDRMLAEPTVGGEASRELAEATTEAPLAPRAEADGFANEQAEKSAEAEPVATATESTTLDEGQARYGDILDDDKAPGFGYKEDSPSVGAADRAETRKGRSDDTLAAKAFRKTSKDKRDPSPDVVSSANALGAESGPDFKNSAGLRGGVLGGESAKAELAKQTAPSERANGGPSLVTQQSTFEELAFADKCARAGEVANDLREQSPSFYRDKVADSKAAKLCQKDINKVAKARVASRRAQANQAGKGGGSATGVKAKSAAQPERAADQKATEAQAEALD